MAQYCLGYCYQYGKGIDRDKLKAFEWYSKAAKGGNKLAKNNLDDLVKKLTTY
ncbi:hypothetical protein C1645_792372 [Glomus cerebriforme]|uniref:Sel1 repeat protein n=1 Tax=Glomus cerebriforme TaxID=658196 RepID=A0A397S886_9GLOM|nr:hypothetical protein C1645_792372 [Glomus cerebriforme]